MELIQRQLIIDGESSRKYGLIVTSESTQDSPSRTVTTYTVPGRHGVLIQDGKTYGTVTVTYHAYLAVPAPDRQGYMRRIREWLLRPGMRRIEDTQATDEVRYGYITGGISFTKGDANKLPELDISITMQPQRYLKKTQNLKSIASGYKAKNPTGQTAFPLLRLAGAGEITFAQGTDIRTVEVPEAMANPIYVDCESMDAYYGVNNLNGKIEVLDNIFPVLADGETQITYTGFSKAEIAERYFWI